MKSDLHVAMTKAAAAVVGWRGNHNILAKSATLPDMVPVVRVADFGAHLLGHNLASLTHFCRPIVDGADIVCRGYNYHRDRSLPGIELPDVSTHSNFPAWNDLLFLSQKEKDPMHVLLKGIRARGDSDALDEITFPSAGNMAAWLETCSEVLSGDQLSAVAGAALHFVQDCAVPHHAMGLLGDGHQAFEGDMSERFAELHAAGDIDRKLKVDLRDLLVSSPLSLRTICEETAKDAQISMMGLTFARCVWIRSWRALVDQAVTRGLRATVAGLLRLELHAKTR